MLDSARPAAAPPHTPASEILSSSHLFAGLREEQVREFVDSVADEVELRPGELLMAEGDPADALYVLLAGSVEVLIKDQRGTSHVVRQMNPVQAIGDVALFDRRPRSATVRAVDRCRLLRVTFERLDQRYPVDRTLGGRLRANVASGVMWGFREMGSSAVEWLQAKLEESEKRVELGRFVVKLIVPVILYMFLMGGISTIVNLGIPASLLAVPIMGMFGIAVFQIIRESPYPPAAFGLTLAGWRASLYDGILLTLPVLLLIVAVKALLLPFSSAPQKTLFDMGAGFGLSPAAFWGVALVYSLFVPVQEMTARCGVQVPFERFLDGPRKHWTAILLSSLIFSATHLHQGVSFALSVLPMGIFWGWMFRRHMNLVGVSASHVIVGNFAFLVVGFWGILY